MPTEKVPGADMHTLKMTVCSDKPSRLVHCRGSGHKKGGWCERLHPGPRHTLTNDPQVPHPGGGDEVSAGSKGLGDSQAVAVEAGCDGAELFIARHARKRRFNA